ncbi:MAG: class I SAM-dependent methyltransferase [Clostridiales bacterium]|nr:class I SAM-dependent methyltransferase [Clostridiales bacterium]
MKNVYDNEMFFNEYQTMRAVEINANNLIENPIMKSMLPDLNGKTILDLGCGDGNMETYFVKNGAKKVVALDLSENMIAEAKKINNHDNVEYYVMGMEDISSINQKFDIVYSSLAFHYIQDFNKLLNDIYNLLNQGGILIYSQESPLSTAPIFENDNYQSKIFIGNKRYNLLSDYCNQTERNNYWNGVPVTKYHRTYAGIVNALIKNKFNILEMQDSYASAEAIALCPKYAYQNDKPYFTFVKAEK